MLGATCPTPKVNNHPPTLLSTHGLTLLRAAHRPFEFSLFLDPLYLYITHLHPYRGKICNASDETRAMMNLCKAACLYFFEAKLLLLNSAKKTSALSQKQFFSCFITV